jgi:hypothetical protein
MGKDKYENEDLLKFGFPEDIWFHVDDLSSAHVYLRLKDEETVEGFSDKAKEECCQLVKENSIEGERVCECCAFTLALGDGSEKL